MKDFIYSFRIAKKNNWLLYYSPRFEVFFASKRNINDTSIELIHTF